MSVLPSSRENVTALLLNLEVFVDGHGRQFVVRLKHLREQPCAVVAHSARGQYREWLQRLQHVRINMRHPHGRSCATLPAESINGPPPRRAGAGASSLHSACSASDDWSDVPSWVESGGGGAERRSSSSCAILASWAYACAYASRSKRSVAARRSSSLSCSSLWPGAEDGVGDGRRAAMRSKSVGEESEDGRGTLCRCATVLFEGCGEDCVRIRKVIFFYLDTAADLLLSLILLDLCLPPSGGVSDGGSVLCVQLALGPGRDFVELYIRHEFCEPLLPTSRECDESYSIDGQTSVSRRRAKRSSLSVARALLSISARTYGTNKYTRS